ncbi:MAG: hypothetical protein ACK56F_26250, partial [bacterium]
FLPRPAAPPEKSLIPKPCKNKPIKTLRETNGGFGGCNTIKITEAEPRPGRKIRRLYAHNYMYRLVSDATT